MLKSWLTSEYLHDVIDTISPEIHSQGLSELIDQLRSMNEHNDVIMAKSLEQRAFIELHTGPWDAIWPRWRTLYTISILIQIRQTPDHLQKEILRMIDQILIFGDGLCRPQLTSYASIISSSLANELDANPVFIDDQITRSPSYMGVDLAMSQAILRSRDCNPFRFHREFVSAGIPIILEGMIDSWPCRNERSFKNMAYLKQKLGFRTVLIESGSDYLNDPNWRPEQMTVREFIDACILSNQPTGPVLYLAQNDLFDQVPDLAADVSVPDFIDFDPSSLADEDGETTFDGPQLRRTVWFGPAGTLSPLHTDPENNLLCQVFGYKYVRLYENTAEFRDHNEAGDISKDKYFEGILHPGDMLFIPKGMWHHVESLSTSFSVNFWWWHRK